MRSRRRLAVAFPATVAAVLLGLGWPGRAEAGPPPAPDAACGPALELAARFGDAGRRPRERRGWLQAVESLEQCSEVFTDDPRAPKAALAAAQLTVGLYRRSRLRADFELAVMRLGAVATRWPGRPEGFRAQLATADFKLEFGSTNEALALYGALARTADASPAAAEARRHAARALAIARTLAAADPQAAAFEGPAPPPAPGASLPAAPAAAATAPAPAPAAAPAVTPALPPGPVVPSRVLGITVKRTGSAARIVISTDRPVGYTHGEIPPMENRPARVFVDIPGGTLATQVVRQRTFPQSKLVRALRAAPNKIGQARIVVELVDGVVAQVYASERPPGVVIEARERKDAEAPKELKPPEGLTLSEAAAMPIRRIVVDAGHGGAERGAVGQGGLEEKEVTLDVARRLQPLLQRRGFEVVLTRDDDRTVPLEARTRRANEARADLFVSVHVNAAPDKSRDGVETYYLDISDDAYTRRLAQRENQGSGRTMADLQLLTADLMTRAHTEDSARLAAEVERNLKRTLRKGSGQVRGVRKALFYVLLGARMPAVLCELSFLSNARAEKEMRDPKFRERAAEGIAAGVVAYVASRQERIDGGKRSGIKGR
jgi:N-acetylmuramoyl-L-alanine amidase